MTASAPRRYAESIDRYCSTAGDCGNNQASLAAVTGSAVTTTRRF
jgi:hypothetical protein